MDEQFHKYSSEFGDVTLVSDDDAQATGPTRGVNDVKHCRSGRLTGKIDFHFKLRGV